MGGKSTFSSSKSKSETVSKNILGNSTTSNPFVVSSTTNDGTNSAFAQGSAFETINDFINDSAQTLLQNYMNPSLNSATNQSLLNSYTDNLGTQSRVSLENNVINPLSQRNMIRSSQATDMYNNLQKNINDSIAGYTNELLSSSQANAADMLNNLMALYLNGYNAVSNNQAQSLNTSAQKSTNKSSTTGNNLNFGLAASYGKFQGDK